MPTSSGRRASLPRNGGAAPAAAVPMSAPASPRRSSAADSGRQQQLRRQQQQQHQQQQTRTQKQEKEQEKEQVKERETEREREREKVQEREQEQSQSQSSHTTISTTSTGAAVSNSKLVTVPTKTDKSKLLTGDDDESLNNVSKTLRFKSPKEVDDVYLCSAVLPQSKRLNVQIENGDVVGVANGVNKTRRVSLALSKDQAKQLMSLDDYVLTYVKNHIESWFEGNMDEALVEEYYRPVVVAEAGKGVCAKMLVTAKNSSVELGDHDATFQLVGIQFRKQQFSLIWKVVETLHEEDRIQRQPPKTKMSDDTKHSLTSRYGFLSESESSADSDLDHGGKERTKSSEEDVPAPSWEEYETMRENTLSNLREKQSRLQAELRRTQEAVEMLTLADNQDVDALDRAGEACDPCEQ